MAILGAMPTGRRAFLGAAAAAVAAACAPGGASVPETLGQSLGPPETTTIRIDAIVGCDPWTWLADDFFKEEGFTDVRYADQASLVSSAGVASGRSDIDVNFGNDLAARVDAGYPIVALAGTHTGCIELWARPGINSLRDLRGKRVVVYKKDILDDLFYGLWVSFLASVGIDRSEVQFAEDDDSSHTSIDYFLNGRADAILASITEGPALRASPNTPGKLVVDFGMDKPWSQQFCCLLVANSDWAKAHPNATKRATRAVLRAIDQGAKDRARAVVAAVQKQVPDAADPQLLLEAIKSLNYGWRDFDPEETLRFYALRLADAKLLKKPPSRILAEGTNFAFFRQMQKELKA